MHEVFYICFIYASGAQSLAWSFWQIHHITSIKIPITGSGSEKVIEEEEPIANIEDQNIIRKLENRENEAYQNNETIINIGKKISEGASAFIKSEYIILFCFLIVFGGIVYLFVDYLGTNNENMKLRPYGTVSFFVGSLTSMLCGYIGLKVAVMSNYRTTYKAINSLEDAFDTSYRGGCAFGFATQGISLIVQPSLILILEAIFDPKFQKELHGMNVEAQRDAMTYTSLVQILAAYGLGGSLVALFARVGGGIYTKAADVGADLVGKVEAGLAEDSPKNPATIADNVGDNVGDIAGMGADLFGSFSESTCAAILLIVSEIEIFNADNKDKIWLPIMISALGVLACILTSWIGLRFSNVNDFPKIQKALNLQLILSTILTLIFIWLLCFIMLPNNWKQADISTFDKVTEKTCYWWYFGICITMGQISGLLIGISTDYYTSDQHAPVKNMAQKCLSGPAINIIYGLANGYRSVLIPVVLLMLTIFVCSNLLGMLGIAQSAIGMLSTLSIGLSIDGFGPICDNAGGIAEMSNLPSTIRDRTDALDACGNTTAAIGKGFAIGSAALVGFSLYGAFVEKAKKYNPKIGTFEVDNGWIFGSMLFGAMLPYLFSAMTMESVGQAADVMVQEVRRQFKDERILSGAIEPDHQKCIKIATNNSLVQMIAPGLLVTLTPIIFGVLLGNKIVAGILPGTLLSGIQLAISMSNTGGSWDNAKKYIESGRLETESHRQVNKGSPEHQAGVIGDTIGDPMKDTSGPSLNILIKLMAIISLVFVQAFSNTEYLVKHLNLDGL